MKITIITITYNSEKTIARTMESVLSQSMLEKSNGEDRVEYLLIEGKSSRYHCCCGGKLSKQNGSKGYRASDPQ